MPKNRNIVMNLLNEVLRDDIKIISVDFFDTLFLRDCIIPTDIFYRIEKKYALKNFAKERIQAERIARKNKGMNEDVNLKEIYQNFHIDENVRKKYMAIELKEEKKALRPNQNILPILKEAKKANKTLILISDSYLHLAFFKEVLERFSIDFFDEIFVSSEFRLTKASGNLFKATEKYGYFSLDKKLNKSCLHIGDNILADYKIPKKHGMSVFYMPSMRELLKSNSQYFKSYNFLNDAEQRFLSFFCERNYSSLSLEPNKHELKDLVTLIVAPMLFFHLKYLINFTNKNNAKTIYLAYRDGYVFRKVLDAIGIYQGKIKKIYISRNMRMLASIHNFDDLKKSFEIYPITEISIMDFLIKRIGIKPDKVDQICKHLDFNDPLKKYSYENLPFITVRKNFDFLMLPKNNLIEETREYLNSFNKDTSLFWDIGYRGSIENFYRNNKMFYIQLFKFSFLNESNLTKSQFQVTKDIRLQTSMLHFLEEIIRENKGSVYAVQNNNLLREQHKDDSEILKNARDLLIDEIIYYMRKVPDNISNFNLNEDVFKELINKFKNRKYISKITRNIEFEDSNFLGQNKFNKIKYLNKNNLEKLLYRLNEKIFKKH